MNNRLLTNLFVCIAASSCGNNNGNKDEGKEKLKSAIVDSLNSLVDEKDKDMVVNVVAEILSSPQDFKNICTSADIKRQTKGWEDLKEEEQKSVIDMTIRKVLAAVSSNGIGMFCEKFVKEGKVSLDRLNQEISKTAETERSGGKPQIVETLTAANTASAPAKTSSRKVPTPSTGELISDDTTLENALKIANLTGTKHLGMKLKVNNVERFIDLSIFYDLVSAILRNNSSESSLSRLDTLTISDVKKIFGKANWNVSGVTDEEKLLIVTGKTQNKEFFDFEFEVKEFVKDVCPRYNGLLKILVNSNSLGFDEKQFKSSEGKLVDKPNIGWNGTSKCEEHLKDVGNKIWELLNK